MNQNRKGQLGVVIFIVVAVIFGLIKNFWSAPSQKQVIAGTYEFINLDSVFYTQNVFVFCATTDSSYIIVLSEKLSPSPDPGVQSNFHLPERGKTYDLTLERVDKTSDMLPASLRKRAPVQLRLGDILIWDVDSLALPTYRSPDIVDKYITRHDDRYHNEK